MVETPHLGVREKPRLPLPCDLGAQVRLGDRGVMNVGHCTPKTLTKLPVFSEFLAESGSISNGLWQMVACPDPITHMLCGSFAVSSPERGTMLHGLFEQLTSHAFKEFNHISWPTVSIFCQDVLI